MLKTLAYYGQGFQHLPRGLANVNVLENNVWSLLLHKFNIIFVKIWEKYGTILCHRLEVNEGKLIIFNICLPGPRASKDSRWRSSFYSTSMFRKCQVGCCTTVVGKCKMRWNSINKKEDRPIFICYLPCRTSPILSCASLQFLTAEKLAACLLTTVFYSQFGVLKYENNIVLNLFHDMMTYFS